MSLSQVGGTGTATKVFPAAQASPPALAAPVLSLIAAGAATTQGTAWVKVTYNVPTSSGVVESPASPESTLAVTDNHELVIALASVSAATANGAQSYNVYGGATSGSEKLLSSNISLNATYKIPDYGAISTSGAAAPTVAVVPALLVSVDGSGRFDGQRFSVIAAGNAFQNGTAGKVSVILYFVDPVTGVKTAIKSPGSNGVTVAAGTWCNWTVEADMIMDSDSGLLTGAVQIICNNTLIGSSVVGTVMTGLNPNHEPAAQFALGVAFNVSDALNLANLTQYDVE